jgi:hypothetical protein
MHACLRRTRTSESRACEMMSMKGGGDRCECAECPEFLRVVGRRTVTMYVSNGRFFHRALETWMHLLESSCVVWDGALSVSRLGLHRLPPLQPFCSVEPHGC